VRRRFAPHQLATPTVELARERIVFNIIQRQLGHNLGTTSIYLQGIDTEAIIATVHNRRGPMMSATAGPGSNQRRERLCAPATTAQRRKAHTGYTDNVRDTREIVILAAPRPGVDTLVWRDGRTSLRQRRQAIRGRRSRRP
jgi:hypothetical protein